MSSDTALDSSTSTFSDSNKDNYSSYPFEYDSEGESVFDGEVKKRDEGVFSVIGSDGYLKFKDKPQLRDDDKVQVFGLNESAPIAPLLTPSNDIEPDNIVTPSSFLCSNETVFVIFTIRVKQTGNTSKIKSTDFENNEFLFGKS